MIKPNVYDPHPANIIIAMLSDKRLNVRQEDINQSQSAKKSSPKVMRKFEVRERNCEAADNADIINWLNCKVILVETISLRRCIT